MRRETDSRDHRRFLRLRGRLFALAKRLPGWTRILSGCEHAGIAVTAALLAYGPTRSIGLKEGFWAAITAISVAQGRFDATRNTARDQFIGAGIGALIGGGVASAVEPHLWGYAGAVVVAILACWVANVASAARLAGVTATIIMLVPRDGSVLPVILARVGEVAWGVCCAVAVVWLFEGTARWVRRTRRDGRQR